MLDTVPPQLLADLRQRHGEARRHYHDWTHIEALLGHMSHLRKAVSDRDAVLYAILFHDAIYDPRSSENERRSAELLASTDVPIAPASKVLALRMIEATDGHALPAELAPGELADAALFLDMDLAILGADERRFAIYEDQVRREYAHVPDEAFRAGRARILRHFAARERLYFSDWGRERFEDRARRNIAHSLAALGAADA